MRTSLIPLAGLIPAALIAPLSAQSAGPVNVTSGTATWAEQSTPTGTRTVFTVRENSILEWPNGFNLPPGSEMVFNFASGSSVVNVVGGSGVNVIGGTVTSNGNLTFSSPHADLVVSGSVTANAATFATLLADSSVLLTGARKITFTGNPQSSTGLLVSGSIESKTADLVLTGQRVTLGDASVLKAKGSALIAGGSRVELVRSLLASTLHAASSDGFVYHLGTVSGLRIQVSAGSDVLLKGQLQALLILLETTTGKLVKDVGALLLGDILGGLLQDGDSYAPNDSHLSTSLDVSAPDIQGSHQAETLPPGVSPSPADS